MIVALNKKQAVIFSRKIAKNNRLFKLALQPNYGVIAVR
ncbi:hypothetical protein F542_8100 [Bibersteinia trehalosi USDA-ARS-USMARC-188]|uniref:Uncharacterized protein n=2 Tax=Bibersteinia trehalosi TaxID=47735 RepID=A0A4V7I919_BIBTR|nr:hypothetical protein WQG_13940 [Bibersteinia trehalosi USDA-ARS-USMARC-192]AHG81528.1 hypothetical protein F542_8100 [Bibersteinia trehalosi USDA-ARS-USMARC-188]AHG83802.1 hypothetical protein F543_9380 [Bibersteinia trehalosi USDA-ARS-USMARC-189]